MEIPLKAKNVVLIRAPYLILLVLVGSLLFGMPGLSIAEQPNSDRPNLLLIMVDDLGKEWVECYGAEGIETPNINRLAKSGTRFENFYCMPQCTPTRLTLLTGQYPFRHGWVNHWDVPRWGGGCSFDPRKNPSFPKQIQDAGYKTCAAGKWQIDDFRVEPEAMNQAGFEAYCMWTGYEGKNPPSGKRYQDPYIFSNGQSKTYANRFGPDVYTDFLVEFIGKHKSDPMFLYFPMALTHGPLVPTPLEPQAKSKMEKHRAMVRYTDHLVGRLVQALERHGLREKTVIVFTTDNGTGRGIVGSVAGQKVKGGKAQTTENGICVPFIASCPGLVPEGKVSNALIDMTDIAPTFCELAQGSWEKDTGNGKSFARVLLGQQERSDRDWIMSMGGGNFAKLTEAGVENQYWFRDRVLRDERFKFYVGTDRKLKKIVDLKNDPREETNLLGLETKELQLARTRVFEAAMAEMPAKDNDPKYDPLPTRDWYTPVVAKSQEWKKGKPANR